MVQVQKRILTKPPLQTSPRLSFSRAPGASTTWGGKTSKSSRRGAAGVANRRKGGEYFKECEKKCPPNPPPDPDAKGSKGGKRGKGKKAAPKKQVTDKGESAPPPRGRKADNQPVPEDDSAQQSDTRRTKRVRRSPEEAKLEREQRIATTIKPGAKPSYEYVENLKSPVKRSKKRYIFRFECLIFGTQVPPRRS
ncbi:hypothetical protein DFH09DRAFT_1377521 [Mycena vulgaris]|nr:hypothetical protein DFH09DRAFT_1377521 [Mycena vulgaris]